MEAPMLVDAGKALEPDAQLILTEAQVLLAEERTALSVIRSAIAVMALPISVARGLLSWHRHGVHLRRLKERLPLLRELLE